MIFLIFPLWWKTFPAFIPISSIEAFEEENIQNSMEEAKSIDSIDYNCAWHFVREEMRVAILWLCSLLPLFLC